MSTFSQNFSVDHFRAESTREQEQLHSEQQQAEPAKVFSAKSQELFAAIARHGVPVAAARIIAISLDALVQRVETLEDAARNSKPAHLRKVEQR